MSATYLGGLSVGDVVPTLPIAMASVTSLLAPQAAKVADIQARLALPFQPPNPAVMLAGLQAALAGLASQLAHMPLADAQMRVQLAGDLAHLLGLVAQTKSFIETISGALSTGGVHAWTLDSPARSLGSDLGSVSATGLPGGSGPSQRCRAIVLATADPAAWGALSTVLRT